MNRDDIIRLARQASEVGSMWWRARDTLERFAALVESEAAARENEACTKVIDEIAERHKEQSDATYWALRDAAFQIRNRREKNERTNPTTCYSG